MFPVNYKFILISLQLIFGGKNKTFPVMETVSGAMT